MSEWISVDERLPEKGQSVIFAIFNGNLGFGYLVERRDGGFHFNDYLDDEPLVNISGVTHWMPLPEPPSA